MRYVIGILLVGLAGFFVQNIRSSADVQIKNIPAIEAESSLPDQPLNAVMFYSNWCGACQILDPKIESIKANFADRPVTFIKFDFSFAMVRGGKLQKLAEQNNLEQTYANNKGKTGFMLLIDPGTEQVLDIITMGNSAVQIAEKLNASLHRKVLVGAQT